MGLPSARDRRLRSVEDSPQTALNVREKPRNHHRLGRLTGWLRATAARRGAGRESGQGSEYRKAGCRAGGAGVGGG